MSHQYDQVEYGDKVIKLRDTNLNANLNGRSGDIGQEINLIMNFREWKHLELGPIGAVFDPGSGFDNLDLAYSVFFDVNYNF